MCLAVIDPQGVVRGVRVGYGKTLHDDVAKMIDEALAKLPAGAGGGGQSRKAAGAEPGSAR